MYLDIWIGASSPSGDVLCLPDLALTAGKRMWLTDLKGNYWGESLSMPLTDNRLIIVLIIYSSARRLFSILLAVSLKRSTETFNGLAGSRLWWATVKTTTLDLANLHFYIVQGSTPLINFPGKRKRNMEKEKNNPKQQQQHIQPWCKSCLSTPTLEMCMKWNWLELLTRRHRPLRGQGGGRGEGRLVCYLIQWKMHG